MKENKWTQERENQKIFIMIILCVLIFLMLRIMRVISYLKVRNEISNSLSSGHLMRICEVFS